MVVLPTMWLPATHKGEVVTSAFGRMQVQGTTGFICMHARKCCTCTINMYYTRLNTHSIHIVIYIHVYIINIYIYHIIIIFIYTQYVYCEC